MNEISTKITRLDLNFILDNCYKPSLWDKVWTIFVYDGWRITFELNSINTKNKQLNFYLKLYEPNRSYHCNSTGDNMNFQKEHRNLEVIQKGINGSILRWLLEWHERTIIQKTESYQQAYSYQNQLEALAEEKAIALLDELNITNSDIREAYIDSQKEKHKTSKYTEEVMQLYKGTKLTKLLMSYCLFTNDKTNYEKYRKIAKLNGFKVGDVRKEIKAELDKIESGEMYEELEMDII